MTDEWNEKKSDSVPLGIVADRLEEVGEMGSAAAIRALEYALRENLISVDSTVSLAVARLGFIGEVEMMKAVNAGFRELSGRLAERRSMGVKR